MREQMSCWSNIPTVPLKCYDWNADRNDAIYIRRPGGFKVGLSTRLLFCA